MPTIATLAIGSLFLLVALLAIRVSLLRMQKGIYLGDGGDKQLHRAIRRHGNSLEHATGLSLLLLCADLLAAPRPLLIGFAVAAVAARVIHAAGFGRARKLTIPATVVTYTAEVLLAAGLLALAVRAL